MKKFALLGAAAVLGDAGNGPGGHAGTRHDRIQLSEFADLTGGYGVRTPYNTGRYPRMPYYRHVYYGPVGVVGGAVGTAAAIAAAPFVSVEDSYAYYEPY